MENSKTFALRQVYSIKYTIDSKLYTVIIKLKETPQSRVELKLDSKFLQNHNCQLIINTEPEIISFFLAEIT